MTINGNGQHSYTSPVTMDFDHSEYTSLIMPGRGKIEGLTFDTNSQIEAAVHTILHAIGEQPEREGLLKTPARVARMYAEVTAGYHIDPEALINDAVFSVDYDEMVLVKDIDFYSMCEHHMLPFMGKVHVAYIPDGKVIGLSKIPRIVEMYARRLQVQERMTVQIADFLDHALHPQGGGSGIGRVAYVCGDARCEKGQCADDNLRDARCVSQ